MKTKAQIAKAMKAAGINGTVSGRGRDWEVELADEKAFRAFRRKVANLGVGGFKTGWGGWILRPGYTVDPHDYCDTAARIHY